MSNHIASNTYKDGILQGVVVTPGEEEPVEIRYIGPPLDLMKVATFLGLELKDGQEEESSGFMELKDPRGGYATIQPCERASDLIQTVLAFAKDLGQDPPPFLL